MSVVDRDLARERGMANAYSAYELLWALALSKVRDEYGGALEEMDRRFVREAVEDAWDALERRYREHHVLSPEEVA